MLGLSEVPEHHIAKAVKVMADPSFPPQPKATEVKCPTGAVQNDSFCSMTVPHHHLSLQPLQALRELSMVAHCLSCLCLLPA